MATDNAAGRLLPYLTANVNIEVGRHRNVLRVPNAALRWRPRPDWIVPGALAKPVAHGETPAKPVAHEAQATIGRLWVPDGKLVRPSEVRVGLNHGTMTEVSGDELKEGLEVIVGGTLSTGDTSQRTPVQRAIAAMGVNSLIVLPGTELFGGGAARPLTAQDVEEIAHRCPAVSHAAPVVRAVAEVAVGNRTWVPASILGTTLSYLAVRDWDALAEGSAFADSDIRSASPVSDRPTLRSELFQGESPVGKRIRIRNVDFKVAGVLDAKGCDTLGRDQDDIVFAPWTTIKYRLLAGTNSADLAPAAGKPARSRRAPQA